ncbi:TetR/AcrR family transcriptional regulator [Melittangium boletus]|uniref:TetR/AcrR family transcriptional regulator n=1 Tax=Melittangium boletus TaxID=83453 RepID=UPI003DA57276
MTTRRPVRGVRPTPPRRRRTPAEAREAILRAAEPLLVARGPDGVGLQAVARAAGVSHALVTHYFGTYEALVREVLVRRTRLLTEALTRQAKGRDAPFTASQLLERVVSVFQDPGLGRLLAWALLTGRAEHTPLGQPGALKPVADALALQVGRIAEAQGLPPPSRAAVEMTLLVGLCASQGYTLARPQLLSALGRSPGAEADAQFRVVLSAMLHGALGIPPER